MRGQMATEDIGPKLLKDKSMRKKIIWLMIMIMSLSGIVITSASSNYSERLAKKAKTFQIDDETTGQISQKFDLWLGQKPYLRGANIWQKLVVPSDDMGPGPLGPPYSQQDFNNLAAWGANYVNISHPGIFTEKPSPSAYVVNEGAYSNLDNLITLAENAGLFVVVAFRTGPGRNESVFGGETIPVLDTVWSSTAAQSAWSAMWKETATRLKGRKNVVGYDLMVEPDMDNYAQWNSFALAMTQAIRSVDQDTPIIVEGASWASADSLAELKLTGDAKTVYAVHQYNPVKYTDQRPGKNIPYTSGLSKAFNYITQFKAQHPGVPVTVNEYGVVRYAPGADQYISQEIQLIESEGANHAIWLWETSYPLDYDDYNIRRGPDPKNHKDVSTSALIQVLKSNWSLNTIRPAQTPF
jgi:hypothetical protein